MLNKKDAQKIFGGGAVSSKKEAVKKNYSWEKWPEMEQGGANKGRQ